MSRMLEAAGPSHCYNGDVQSESRARVSSGRPIRLALPAPDIVETVLANKHPADLTLKDLMLPFPVEWAGQRVRFGVRG